MKKVVIAFYASTNHGSDYRVGFEYISYAASRGYDTAIIADIDFNDFDGSTAVYPINVIKLPSIVKSQSLLYKYTDTVPQILWHYRVYKYLKEHREGIDRLWISTSSAQPWFPLKIYLSLDIAKILWGPIGGGGIPPIKIMKRFGVKTLCRELVRGAVDKILFLSKISSLKRNPNNLLPMARTNDARERLEDITKRSIPLIPEFIKLTQARVFPRTVNAMPKFLWVGQDIPRKNFALGYFIFEELKKRFFPEATLDVYGMHGHPACEDVSVTFHGWVDAVPWDDFRGNGVLIISSFREGLTTVLAEAISNGIFVVATPVGAIPAFKIDNVYVLPEDAYPDISDKCLNEISRKIDSYRNKEEVIVGEVDFSSRLDSIIE